MVIRPLAGTPHRVAVAAALHAEWWAADGWSLAETEEFLGFARGPAVPCCVVAEVGGQWLGTVTLDVDDLAVRPDLSPWLASLLVRPEARGRGVGAALVRHVERMAAGLGHPALWLFTPDRAVFYERLGWRRAGVERWGDRAVVLMQRRLG